MNDLIKRRDAIKAIDDKVNGSDNRLWLREIISDLPSADLSSEFSEWARHWFKDFVSRPSGMWIRDEFGSKCSCCGLYAYRDKFDKPWESFYCPNCGVKMKGAGDGTD